MRIIWKLFGLALSLFLTIYFLWSGISGFHDGASNSSLAWDTIRVIVGLVWGAVCYDDYLSFRRFLKYREQ